MIRVGLLCDHPRLEHDILALLKQEGFVALGCINSLEAVQEQLTAWAPEVILITDPFCAADAADIAQRVRGLLPGAARVVLIRGAQPERLRYLFHLGVDDVLSIPQGLSALPNAVRGAVQRQAATGGAGGKVLAVWSPKGGAGCSLIAANLATALQVRQRRRSLLVDLCGPYGGAGALLDVKPERTLADLFCVTQELTANHVLQASMTHASGLAVLCAPRLPEALGGLTPEHLMALADVCRWAFDVTVLDVPSAWAPAVQAALEVATSVLLVVTPDRPAIQAVQAAIPLLPTAKRQRQMVGVVVNRVSSRTELQAPEISTMLGLPVVGSVRSDFFAMEPLVNTARPLVSAPGRAKETRAAQDLLRLAQSVL